MDMWKLRAVVNSSERDKIDFIFAAILLSFNLSRPCFKIWSANLVIVVLVRRLLSAFLKQP